MLAYTEFLEKYLGSNPDALKWVLGCTAYFHSVDDIIDGDIPKDKSSKEFILRTFEFAALVYSHPFYQQHQHILLPLVRMSSNAYMDSVQFEGETEVWKQQLSDGLRQSANELFLAVIEIVGGFNKRREASLELREISYKTHHNERGEII